MGFCEREQLQLKGKVSYETVWQSSETFFHIIIGGSTLLPSILCKKWQWLEIAIFYETGIHARAKKWV